MRQRRATDGNRVVGRVQLGGQLDGPASMYPIPEKTQRRWHVLWTSGDGLACYVRAESDDRKPVWIRRARLRAVAESTP